MNTGALEVHFDRYIVILNVTWEDLGILDLRLATKF